MVFFSKNVKIDGTEEHMENEEQGKIHVTVRVDKWLWAARFFKTRSMATQACGAGHVKINYKTVKASQKVKLEDKIDVLTPGGKKILIVKGLSDKRGPYSIAQHLYEDKTPVIEKEIAPPRFERGKGRPTKKDRRKISKLRRW